MFLLVRQVDLVDQLDQDDVTGRYLWAEPAELPKLVGLYRINCKNEKKALTYLSPSQLSDYYVKTGPKRPGSTG